MGSTASPGLKAGGEGGGSQDAVTRESGVGDSALGSPTSLSFHPLTPANAPTGQTQLEVRGKQGHWDRPYGSGAGEQGKLEKGEWTWRCKPKVPCTDAPSGCTGAHAGISLWLVADLNYHICAIKAGNGTSCFQENNRAPLKNIFI